MGCFSMRLPAKVGTVSAHRYDCVPDWLDGDTTLATPDAR